MQLSNAELNNDWQITETTTSINTVINSLTTSSSVLIQKARPVVCRDGLSFSGIACTIKLLPSKHACTSIWRARPLASTF